MESYNVGILGFGFIGKVHAYGHLNIPLFYDPPPCTTRITHICTSRLETAESGRAQVGADVATTDYREVTENPDVQIVHICTPNHLHRDPLLSAMAHNKHIYCDKPLVAHLSEIEPLEEALTRYTGIAQMTFQNRFFPATLRARQLVEEGFLGRLLQFRACYLHAGSADPDALLKWKLSAEAGGGVIADLASHVLDLLHPLVGDYAALTAATQIAYSDRPSAADPNTRLPVEAEDNVVLLARTRSGALGTIEATKLATGTEDELRFELHGSRGAIRFNLMDPHHLEIYDAAAPDKPLGGRRGWTRLDTGQRYAPPGGGFPSPKASIGWMRSHMACLANFLYCVAANRPAEPGLEQGIYIQKLIDAVRRSARTSAWVELD
ncbi:MAG: Gfo/Idh/MocA family protein [Candidatus Hydrogenedentales bacterium]|jgi:predicted dehydrogenase